MWKLCICAKCYQCLCEECYEIVDAYEDSRGAQYIEYYGDQHKDNMDKLTLKHGCLGNYTICDHIKYMMT